MPRAAYLATLAGRLGPAKAHQKLLTKAGDIGTDAHHLVEWWLRTQIGAVAGPEPQVSEQSLWAFMSFQDWARSVSLKPILIERTVYSKAHGFAGTLDLLARVNGVLTEISVKTAKAIYPDNFMQSKGYVTALVEMGYLPPTGGSLILRLPKNVEDPG
jgi:genome maintenance exonuclease 1